MPPAHTFLTALGGLMFDGVELGLMPAASLSVSQSLLGPAYTPTLGGDWFARFTAALMLGAAVGGILLGSRGGPDWPHAGAGRQHSLLLGVRRTRRAGAYPGTDAG